MGLDHSLICICGVHQQVDCPTKLPKLNSTGGSSSRIPLCLFEQVPHPEVVEIYSEFLGMTPVELNATEIAGGSTRRNRLYFTDIRGHQSAANYRPSKQVLYIGPPPHAVAHHIIHYSALF